MEGRWENRCVCVRQRQTSRLCTIMSPQHLLLSCTLSCSSFVECQGSNTVSGSSEISCLFRDPVPARSLKSVEKYRLPCFVCCRHGQQWPAECSNHDAIRQTRTTLAGSTTDLKVCKNARTLLCVCVYVCCMFVQNTKLLSASWWLNQAAHSEILQYYWHLSDYSIVGRVFWV